MSERLHKLLERQVRDISSVVSSMPTGEQEKFNQFIRHVNEAYQNFESDRELLEKSMELSSAELFTANQEMRKQNARLQELQQNEEKLRYERELILNSVGEGILRLDLNEKITFINPAAVQMLGWRSEEFIGESPYDLFFRTADKDNKKLALFPVENSLLFGTEAEVFQRKDGTKFPVSLTSTPIRENDKIAGAVVIFTDITQKKILEREVQDSVHRAGMAETATGLVHNIGNILNSVNVSAENIQRASKASDVDTFKKANTFFRENMSRGGEFFSADLKGSKLIDLYLQLEQSLSLDFKNIREESVQLQKNIQLIKDVVSMQQSFIKGVEFKEEVWLEEAVESALAMQLNALVRHDIQIVKKYADIKPVIAQRAKVVHILLNLIKNAKEAMIVNPRGVKQLTMEVGEDSTGSFIRISDNGSGITKENLKNVFTYGFTTKKNGHGFGLHYCGNSMTEMGGQISVQSKGMNKGATFTLAFPKLDNSAKAA